MKLVQSLILAAFVAVAGPALAQSTAAPAKDAVKADKEQIKKDKQQIKADQKAGNTSGQG